MLSKLDEDIEKETEKMGIVMRRLGEGEMGTLAIPSSASKCESIFFFSHKYSNTVL